jgi:regulatory protein
VRQQPTCYNKALELLSRRGHFRRELEHKLAKRGYDEEEVASTLSRLEEKNFVDDRALALEYASSRLRRRPMGRPLLASELRARGVDDQGIQEALAELTPEREEELAQAAAEKWRRGRRGTPEALARHLASRGFSRGVIYPLMKGES